MTTFAISPLSSDVICEQVVSMCGKYLRSTCPKQQAPGSCDRNQCETFVEPQNRITPIAKTHLSVQPVNTAGSTPCQLPPSSKVAASEPPASDALPWQIILVPSAAAAFRPLLLLSLLYCRTPVLPRTCTAVQPCCRAPILPTPHNTPYTTTQ